jgi:hypothetical protein
MNREETPSREEGQIAVLSIGFILLALLTATVVMAVSAVYIEHKKLLSLADGAALAASDTFMAGDVEGGAAPAVSLVDERVFEAVQAYLAASGAYEVHDQLRIEPGTGSGPGGTALVTLSAVAHPPVVSFVLPDGIPVEAHSIARSRLTQ